MNHSNEWLTVGISLNLRISSIKVYHRDGMYQSGTNDNQELSMEWIEPDGYRLSDLAITRPVQRYLSHQ